jgi:hypothetical protein
MGCFRCSAVRFPINCFACRSIRCRIPRAVLDRLTCEPIKPNIFVWRRGTEPRREIGDDGVKIGQVEHKEMISWRWRFMTVICTSVPELKLSRSDLTNRSKLGSGHRLIIEGHRFGSCLPQPRSFATPTTPCLFSRARRRNRCERMRVLLYEFPNARRTYAGQPFDIITEPIVSVVLM